MNAFSAARSFAACPPPLAQVAAELAVPRGAIEDAFLGVGEELGECVEIMRGLAADFAALPADFQAPELDEAEAGLALLGERARLMGAAFAEERGAMERLTAALAKAGAPIDDLQRTVRTIGIVAVNARVVAAGVADEMHGLEVFTTDIAELSLAAGEAVGTLSAEYGGLAGEMRRAGAQHAAFDAAHQHTLLGLGRRIAVHLDEIGQRRRAAVAASAGTSEASNQIAASVAQAIFALQVGDNTRQRVEHVETVLAMLEERRAASPADDFLAGAVCRLAAAQLGDAAAVFMQETRAAEQALRRLAADAAMVEGSRRMAGRGNGKGSGKNGPPPLAALSAELRTVAALLHDCEAERARLDTMAGEVGIAVRALCGHVSALQTIEANLRLLSLNATVKCAQMGARGRALNVIAQQLRELMATTESAAQRTIESLEDAAGRAQGISAGQAEGENRVARLEEAAFEAVALLETVDARLGGAVARLEASGPRVGGMLLQAAGRLAAQAGTAAQLAAMQGHLGEHGARIGTVDAGSQEASAFFAALRRLYTMQCERTLHDAVAAELGIAAPGS